VEVSFLFPHQQMFQLENHKPFIHLGLKFKVGAIYSLVLPNYSHLGYCKESFSLRD